LHGIQHLFRQRFCLFKTAKLTVDPIRSEVTKVNSGIFGASYGLCEDEPFKDQPNGAFCSGFLVGENTLVTAGHCIRSASDCAATSFVFDFGYDVEGKDLSSVPSNNVYKCKTIIKQELNSVSKSDYAVIELDRVVTDRDPLEFRTEGTIENDAPLVVIGHPAGIPTKIAAGSNVRSNTPPAYFVANLDTYGGNSGSAVFNSETGVVEGILVRGETDFVYLAAAGYPMFVQTKDAEARTLLNQQNLLSMFLLSNS
jgi:V8-like Glu-specific endopeptidase